MKKKRLTLNDEVNSVYATCSSSTDELKEAGFVDNATMMLKFQKGKEQEMSVTIFLISF